METFDKAIKDFQREIQLIFDEKENSFFEQYSKQDQLTYIIRVVNSISLREKEKLSAFPEKQALIDNALKEYNRMANITFAKLHQLKLLPPMIKPVTGAKIKARSKSYCESTPEIPPETINISDEENSDGAEALKPDKIKIEPGDRKKLFDVLLNEISDGFAKFSNDPNFTKRYQPPDTNVDYDDPVLGTDLEIDITQNNPKIPLVNSDDENLQAPLEKTKYNTKIKTTKSIKAHTDQSIIQLKFDTVELSVFSGDDIEWISFRDEIIYLIHSNEQMSNVIKFHLLKTLLRGIALGAINGSKSSTDYEANAMIIQRYDNQQKIVFGYIRNFLESSTCTSQLIFFMIFSYMLSLLNRSIKCKLLKMIKEI